MSDDFPPPVSHMPTTPGPALSPGDAAAVRAICRLALNRVMEVNFRMDVPTPALKRPAVMSALAACIRGSQEGRGIHLDVFRHARHPDRLVVTQAPLEYLTEYGWVFPETESGGQINLGNNSQN